MSSVPVVIAAVIAVALVALAVAAVRFLGWFPEALAGLQAAVQRGESGPGTVTEQRFRDLEDLVARLPARWEDVKREASRLDSRARYAVSRTRKELAARGLADERLDELGDELGDVDGDGGDDGGLLSMSKEVADIPRIPQHSSPSGDWQALARARKFGG